MKILKVPRLYRQFNKIYEEMKNNEQYELLKKCEKIKDLEN